MIDNAMRTDDDSHGKRKKHRITTVSPSLSLTRQVREARAKFRKQSEALRTQMRRSLSAIQAHQKEIRASFPKPSSTMKATQPLPDIERLVDFVTSRIASDVAKKLNRSGPPANEAAKGHPGSEEPALTNEEKAIGLAFAHPEWTDIEIAKEVGVNRTSLYRWPRFMTIRKASREAAKQDYRGRQRRAQNAD